MKRSKKIQAKIKKAFRVPSGTQYTGLKQLFRNAGLVDDTGQPTAEGRTALQTKS